MWRPLLNTAAVLSLFLCVAVLALWLRSEWYTDQIVYGGSAESLLFRSYHGVFYFKTSRFMDATPGWTHTFDSGYRETESGWMDKPDLIVCVPFFSFFVWTALLPSWRLLFPWLKVRERRRKGEICRSCGYDLRATPDRCPECGTSTVVRAPHPPAHQSEIAFICSVAVAVFSLPCLAFGFSCLIYGIRRQGGYPSEDTARGAGFIFLGVFCLWIAIRWGRNRHTRSGG
jgi:hypothetical protein